MAGAGQAQQGGLIPWWAKDLSGAAGMINARSETATDKPAFRDVLKLRRCLIPADGFYEWAKTGKAKQPYCFDPSRQGKHSTAKRTFLACEVCHGPGRAHADAIEDAEGDEGKTARALEDHPIFSFGVNEKVSAALKQYPIFRFRSDTKETPRTAFFATPVVSNRNCSNIRPTVPMGCRAMSATLLTW